MSGASTLPEPPAVARPQQSDIATPEAGARSRDALRPREREGRP
jgi:hypothetical protein